MVRFIFLVMIIFAAAACSTSQTLQNDFSFSNSTTKNGVEFHRTNNSIDFVKYLSGVKAVIILTDQEVENAFDVNNDFFKKYSFLIKKYFNEIGFGEVAITNKERDKIQNKYSLSETVVFNIKLDLIKNYISSIALNFKTCNGDYFTFTKKTNYTITPTWDQFLTKNLEEIFLSKIEYAKTNELPINKILTRWNEKSLYNYFDNNNITDLEGIYEKYGSSGGTNNTNYKLAVVKSDDDYEIIYLDGADSPRDWDEGELKGEISKTSISNFFKVMWVMSDKSISNQVYLSTTEMNFLTFEFLNTANEFRTKYLKIYPSSSGIKNTSENYISSGTGFFINSDGVIATNEHIVENGKTIVVEVKTGDEVKNYKAELVLSDKINDLALIKINDENFIKNRNIPFIITEQETKMGTSVFTLGFPLIETMGKSIKLAEGIISSQSGYMNDKKAYQISVPINPGNSGGPLFDKKGNLVAVINARYTGAENVSYAIKSNLLLEMLKEKNIAFTSDKKTNLLSTKSFVEQVDELDDVVCLIKIYN